MATTISREYWFSAAHRIEGHPKCGRLHGHNYQVIVEITSDALQNGMIVDYARLDNVLKPLFDRLDHRYLVSASNRGASDPYSSAAIVADRGSDIAALSVFATTAEMLAEWIGNRVEESLGELQELAQLEFPLKLVRVVVCETPKSTAEYRPDA
jgi:queuosine biosynthesis protein QueD